MKSFLAQIDCRSLFRNGEAVLVAVSGGADSVALLDVLARWEEPGLRLVVVHLNHCLRGEASDGDEEFVAELARSYALPFLSRRVEVAELARSERLSLEDAGRRARYQFFHEAADLHGATSIALAHHRDDQAETVLIRLLRGAGGDGLSAMRRSHGMLKRPLLGVSRQEIERYLRLRGLTFRTDESNTDIAILRNRVRHQLIPVLESFNPAVSQRLAATAEILAADEELLERLAEESLARHGEERLEGVMLQTEGVTQEARGLRMRLYRCALRKVRGDLSRISLSHLEGIDRLLLSPRPNARITLPGGCSVRRRYREIIFSAAPPGTTAEWELAVTGLGSFPLPGEKKIVVSSVPRPELLTPGSRNVAFFSPEAVPFPWTVRNFRPGDRFRPLGMRGEQKIKDLFIDRKIPLDQRRLVPLLFAAGELIWICGVRVGERGRVTGSGSVLRVEIVNISP